jgi:hypothetical protein
MTSHLTEFQRRRRDQMAPVWVTVSVGFGLAAFGVYLAAVEGAGFIERLSLREYVQVYDGPMPDRNRRPDSAKLVWISNQQYGVRTPGFEPAASVLVGTFLIVLGASIATGRFLVADGLRQFALAAGILWHAVGMTVGALYLLRAPQPMNLWPLLGVGVYAWFGLIPLTYGIPREWPFDRLYSATFGAFAGAIPGAIVGVVLGGGADLVRQVLIGQRAIEVSSTPGWIVGALSGGLLGAMVMFVYGWFQEPASADNDAASITATSFSEDEKR